MRVHPITGMMLEDGSGALPDDLQAERIHIPYIRLTKGDEVADRMLAELHPKAEPKPEPAHEPEIEKAVAAVAAAVPMPDGVILPPAPAAEASQAAPVPSSAALPSVSPTPAPAKQ